MLEVRVVAASSRRRVSALDRGGRCQTAAVETDGGASRDERRIAAEQRRRQLRRAQDVGLALLALGVLVLAYLALTYSPT